jgi:hypothetical protein
VVARIVLASSKGLGWSRGGLGFHFRFEFFDARQNAGACGKSFAAVAGSFGGIKTATTVARRIDGANDNVRRRTAKICSQTAQRVRGDFGGINSGGMACRRPSQKQNVFMNEEKPKRKFWHRIFFIFVCGVTLIALFYAEEDWRGKRAWEHCKRELEAKGEVLDWNQFIPPPVPDESNFFAAPKMQEWFVGRGETDLSKRLLSTNANLTSSFGEKNLIKNADSAKNYLAWSDQFEPDFDLIREALKRPYARMDGDYSLPYQIPIPNFITVRAVAQTLAQRAHCYLLLNQPEKALDELTLLNDSRHLLEDAPTGKPMTLVAAMINVAVVGLYTSIIAEGLQSHAWQEPQLVELQKQLGQINLLSIVAQAFRSEPAAMTHTLEITSAKKLTKLFSQIDPKQWKWALWPLIKSALIPRGWIYQNMATSTRLVYEQRKGFDLANNIVQPQKFADLSRELNATAKPYKFIAAETIPNFTKAWQTTARNQTMINEAQIVCALESYRLAHDNYPEILDALAPQFIEKIPHDIINGQPLHYRRTNDGQFVLYSVGWNERDDGGVVVLNKDKTPEVDRDEGDWVWRYPQK